MKFVFVASVWLLSGVALFMLCQAGIAKWAGIATLLVTLTGMTLAVLKPPTVVRALRRAIRRRPEPEATNGQPRILFLTSNGAGLGHLTRVLAIVTELKRSDFLILTLSSGFHKVPLPADKVRYFPSYGALGMDSYEWEQAYEMNLSSVFKTYRPHLVVFDGAFVYRPITRLCRAAGIELIWLQRGCWKPGVDRASVQRHNADLFADAVVVPGDYGCPELVDCGPRIAPQYTNPVVTVSRSDLRTRLEACSALGLDPAERYVLVQLGAGVINDVTDLQSSAIESIPKGYVPVVTRNPLRDRVLDGKVVSVEAYPIAINFAAFDFGVVAAGYNSVQEAVSLGLPSVFIPNTETVTDDQRRRALEIQRRGLGLVAEDLQSLREAINTLAKPETNQAIRHALKTVPPADGASRVSMLLEDRLRRTS